MSGSQISAVLAHLKKRGATISPLQALDEFGSFRLADIAYKLRKRGHDVRTTIVRHRGKAYARYSLGRKQK